MTATAERIDELPPEEAEPESEEYESEEYESEEPEEPDTEEPESEDNEPLDVEAVFSGVESPGGWGFGGGGDFDVADILTPEEPKRTRKSKLGGEVEIELAELFTTDGVGLIFADSLAGFFRWCNAEPMSDEAYKATKKIGAYYLQRRAPKGSGKYQPELLLFTHMASLIVPRLPKIAEKTAPWYSRAWQWIKSKAKRDRGEK